MLEDASDILAAVAALKSLAGGVVTPIMTPMRKTVRAIEPPAPAVAVPRLAPDVAPGWRRPVPPAPPTEDWTKDDWRNWRDRLGLKTQAEGAALLRITRNSMTRIELGLFTPRPGLVRLARYIEAYGPLP